MHAVHWQLRDLLSLTTNNIIYFSSGDEIYRLNPLTRQRELLTTLGFQPRCLVASDNWVCCGGDHGDFATITIEPPFTRSTPFQPRTHIDDRLDLSQFSFSTSVHDQTYAASDISNTAEKTVVKISKIGNEIVNCVTLWHPDGNELPRVYKQPVAVLSNNDNSVSVVDLATSDLIQQLRLRDCVNRAVISPDGSLLIAIGDDPYMQIYTRRPVEKGIDTNKYNEEFHWVEYDRIRLKGQMIRPRKDDDMRGSFAAAFSPTGRYLAIGTQYGLICIYDVQLLTNPEDNPLITTCSSSRPGTRAGAIRAMQFSALPIDLLAVTEDSGRVLVFDVRHAFVTRQIIEVNPQAQFVTRIPIFNRTPDSFIDPRLREFDSVDPGSSFEARQQLRMLEMRHQRHSTGLQAEEFDVLNEMTAQRALRDGQMEVPSVFRARSAAVISSIANAVVTNNPPTGITDSNLIPIASSDYLNNGRTTSESLRAFIAERNTDRERRGQAPRRRASVILATAGTALDSTSPTQSNMLETPARALPLPNGSSGDAWAELEALYRVEPSSVDTTARLRVELESDSSRTGNRPRTAQLGRTEPRYVRLGFGGRTLGRAQTGPNDTTGMAWSKDGSLL